MIYNAPNIEALTANQNDNFLTFNDTKTVGLTGRKAFTFEIRRATTEMHWWT